jgi:uncharacterized protein (TIGR00369 family)
VTDALTQPAAYPPEHHLLRDLALEVERRDDGTTAAWMPVVPALFDDTGSVRAGALATVVDVIGGGMSAFAASPNWIATADLTLHIVGRATRGTVEAVGRVLRAGRTTVVIEVDLHVGRDPLGLATMTFSVLPRRDINPVITGEPSTRTAFISGGEFRAPLLESLGFTVVDAARGVIEGPVIPYAMNSFGALQGGVVATVAEVAAEQALRVACDAPVRVTDLQMTYLALVRGKASTTAMVMSATDTFGTAAVELTDIGAEARRTTTARAVATKDA